MGDDQYRPKTGRRRKQRTPLIHGCGTSQIGKKRTFPEDGLMSEKPQNPPFTSGTPYYRERLGNMVVVELSESGRIGDLGESTHRSRMARDHFRVRSATDRWQCGASVGNTVGRTGSLYFLGSALYYAAFNVTLAQGCQQLLDREVIDDK